MKDDNDISTEIPREEGSTKQNDTFRPISPRGTSPGSSIYREEDFKSASSNIDLMNTLSQGSSRSSVKIAKKINIDPNFASLINSQNIELDSTSSLEEDEDLLMKEPELSGRLLPSRALHAEENDQWTQLVNGFDTRYIKGGGSRSGGGNGGRSGEGGMGYHNRDRRRWSEPEVIRNRRHSITSELTLEENLELQHLIANSQNSLLENKERISILKNKMQEQAHLLLCETGQKQALQQDNESLRRQFEGLAKMKDDLQDEKDSLEMKYQTLLNSSTKTKTIETSTPRANKKRHRRRGAGSGSLNQSGYTSSEEDVVGGPVNGSSRTDSALPESEPSFSRENSYDSYEAGESPVKHYSVDGDGVIWKRPLQSSINNAHPLMASTMRYSPSVTSDDCGQDSGYHIPTSDCSTKPYSVCSVTSLEGRQPERVFKVVLLGDSAVGKSSFIMRLCHNRFQAAFQPTIGVDFQVKTMLIQNTVVSLQLWDTAGQERFRAITKSYLRRVDGVLLMYDVTRESSFRNIRDWIQSIEEEDEAPTIMLLGNKADLIATGDQPRAVKTVDGESLAREYNAMFCEVSAKKGTNVQDCCEDLTRSLMKRENQKIAQTNINIVPASKDRSVLSDKSCTICS